MQARISGGERKRTSIGYELITDPSCLLLDEPTSGLDSASAMRVIEQLKLEAGRGMGILATIHQPSAEILYMFDRVILMSEGYMIYSGPPDIARQYFTQFGMSLRSYCNPADKLCSIASHPRRSLNSDVTIEHLYTQCEKRLSQHCKLDKNHPIRLELKMNSRLSTICVTRTAS